MKDTIKRKSRWVTGAWRAHPRHLTVTKVDSEDIQARFDDGQEASFSRSAFLRTFIPDEPVKKKKSA